MIVFIIHDFGILTFEAEGNTPIFTDIDCPHTRPISLQFVKPESRKIHILRLPGSMEPTEYETESFHMRCLNSRDTSRLEEASETFMLETPNHTLDCNPYRCGCQVHPPFI
jgi:hypothetical protein